MNTVEVGVDWNRDSIRTGSRGNAKSAFPARHPGGTLRRIVRVG